MINWCSDEENRLRRLLHDLRFQNLNYIITRRDHEEFVKTADKFINYMASYYANNP